MRHVSECGWDQCVFTDESLANKKILPGFVFKCLTAKKWNDRCRVTAQSIHLMAKQAIVTSGPWMFHC